MSYFSRRLLSVSIRNLQNEIKTSVKLHHRQQNGGGNGTKFEKSFPSYDKKPAKIWDERNISKDEFFRKKYSFINDKQREALDKKVERQRRHRENRRQQENSERSTSYTRERQYTERLKIPKNPLSEYVYGTHAVLGALVANKRQLFRTLYVLNFKIINPLIRNLTKQFNLRVEDDVPRDVLNNLSGFGVHNGIVLETRPLEIPMTTALGPHDSANGTYQLAIQNEMYNTIETQEREVARRVEPDTEEQSATPRYPLGLYLDGLMDPRNVGAIIRSGYFFGLDFVVVPDSESAKLGPVASKSSAGALEVSNIFKTSESLHFLEKSRKNGWVVISTTGNMSGAAMAKNEVTDEKIITPDDLYSMCSRAPVLLVMGSEGLGVRTNIMKRSDYVVGIKDNREGGAGIVDSLNASVAAALLIEKCVNKR